METPSWIKIGFTFGGFMEATNKTLRVGDHFWSPGNRRRSPLSGCIVKINRVNFTYTTTYFDHPMELTCRIDDLSTGARIMRGNTAYEVK